MAVELKCVEVLKNFGRAYQAIMTNFPSHACDSACETPSYCMYVQWQLQFMHCWPRIVLDTSVAPSAAHLHGIDIVGWLQQVYDTHTRE